MNASSTAPAAARAPVTTAPTAYRNARTRHRSAPTARPAAPAASNCAATGGRRPRAVGWTRLRAPAAALALLVLALPLGAAWSQAAPPTDDAAAGGASAVTATDAVPAVGAIGVQFGFPAYRTAAVGASVQARFLGFAVRVGGGPGGVTIGLAARAYLPLPVPLPTYVAGGVDAYAGRFAPSLAVGAHVPIAERWRLDLEVGGAWTPVLDEVRLTPVVAAGVSYAVPLELAPATAGAGPVGASGGARGAPACVAGPPDPGALDAALAATIARFVADAVATYGSVYRDLRYATSVERTVVDGARATIAVAYDGSVVEILTGHTISAAGTAEVDFRWDGCRWLRTALRY